MAVCTHDCVFPVGRRPQSADSEQFGGGNTAAGSLFRLVYRKNGQVTNSLWSKARTPAAVDFHRQVMSVFSPEQLFKLTESAAICLAGLVT